MWKPGMAFCSSYHVGVFVLDFLPPPLCSQDRRGEVDPKTELIFQLQALPTIHCLNIRALRHLCVCRAVIFRLFFFSLPNIPFCVTFFLQLTCKKPSPLENAVK